jgi:hypothetical protein
MNISGEQVYTIEITSTDDDDEQLTYTPYTGEAMDVYDDHPDKGKKVGTISPNGKLDLFVGTPDDLGPITDFLGEGEDLIYIDIRLSVDSARFASMDDFYTENNECLNKSKFTITGETSETVELTSYMYANKDVSVIAKGTVLTEYDDRKNILTIDRYPDIKWELKQGWNALYVKRVKKNTPNTSIWERTVTVNDSPDINWVLFTLI